MRILFLSAAISIAAAATAQETIQREVNVTRAYEPSVSDFLKQRIDPDMSDTTQLHPEYVYDVKPRPLSAGLGMMPIGPMSINTVDNLMSLPFYLKVGGGAPAQSTLLFSAARQYVAGNAGLTVNHYGQYGKIENDEGVKAPAFQTFNSARVFGNRRFGRDLLLDGELGYEFNKISRYGYFNYGNPLPAETDVTGDGLSQYFNILKARVKVGNSFTDMSKINWSLSVDETYIMERFRYDIGGFKARLDVGFKVGPGVVRINGQFNNVNGNNELEGLNGNFAVAGILYSYSGSDGFKVALGADVTRDITGKISNFMPQLNIEKPLFGGIVIPFAEIQSTQQSNTYLTQAMRNPYTMSGHGAPRTYTWDGRAGIKGRLFHALKYKLYGGYGRVENIYWYVNHYDLLYAGNAFTTLSDTASVVRGGVEMELNVTGALDLYANIEYRSYDLDNYLYVGGMPDFEAAFGARYRYSRKFQANVDAVLFGERFFYENYGGGLRMLKAKSMMEVNLGLDYLINDRMGVFLDLNNLLNQKLYRFNRFPLLGINGMAGIKLSF